MSMHFKVVGEQQQIVSKESTSLVEILAALIIGGIGMAISLSGLSTDDILVYTLGIIIMVFSAGWIAGKFISVVLDIIERLKKKDK